jgi:hypothetical protein
MISKFNNMSVTVNGSSSLITGLIEVETAGTKQQLPNIPCHEVTIIAKRTNTGYIYIGASNVSSIEPNYGVELAAKESFTFTVSNVNILYMDATVSGEGISIVAI